MPDSGTPSSPIDGAVAQVQRWLDHGAGASWVRREPQVRPGVAGAWTLDLQAAGLPVTSARLVIPTNFPATPCALYVDPGYFLKIPHIEANGHVCLGGTPIPGDYDDPIGAVKRALQTFQDELLIPAQDPAWVAQQFQAERASYWTQACLSRRFAANQRPAPTRTYVDTDGLERWSRASLVGYLRNGTRDRRFTLQVVALGEAEAVAKRHGWDTGTMLRGNALVVRLPASVQWTPADWPTSFAALEHVIEHATGGELALAAWLRETGWRDTPDPVATPRKRRGDRRRKPPPGQRPLLVVLVHEGASYGYQLYTPIFPGLTPPAVEVVQVTRIDPIGPWPAIISSTPCMGAAPNESWCLAADPSGVRSSICWHGRASVTSTWWMRRTWERKTLRAIPWVSAT